MPTLDISNFNKVCALGGGFVISFGLVSLILKESLYLSESFIALGAGAFLSKSVGLGLVDPLEYARGSQETLWNITRNFTRLVLGAQLVLAGVQLPNKYLLHEWKSLIMLLGPVMILMWVISSIIIWLFVPQVTMVGALAIAACITPTDPVLANSIVKGKFADEFIAPRLQDIIVAESGANDGLGYPFLFIALYFIEYRDKPSKALGLWCSDTLFFVIVLSVIYGALIGWLGIRALHWAEKKGSDEILGFVNPVFIQCFSGADLRLIERESFLVFIVVLALFIVGTCGMVGSDDVLACFIAGNVFSLDGWYRHETKDDSLTPTIDHLLNLTIFLYFGAIAPWSSFLINSTYVSFPQLICISVAILIFRRLPAVLLTFRYIPTIRGWKQAVFVGYFGPIGVSAVFYLTVLVDYTHQLRIRSGDDEYFVARLQETAVLVVWFMVVSSVFVHGITVPLIMLGLKLRVKALGLRSYSFVQGETIGDLEDIETPPSFKTPLLTSDGNMEYGTMVGGSIG